MASKAKPTEEIEIPEEAVESTEVEETVDESEEDLYIPIPIAGDDKFSIKLTMPVKEHPQEKDSHYISVGGDFAALPGETADDLAARVQEIALGALFDTVDRYKGILQHRRAQQIAEAKNNK